MKRILGFLVILVVFGCVGFVAWRWYTVEHEPRKNELVLFGNVDIREVRLAFNGHERIASMAVDEGQRVTEGQPLAQLDTVSLEHAVAQAAAQVDAQREIVARYEAGSRPEEIRKARADMEAAVADAKNAVLVYKRQSSLAARNVAAIQRADDAKAAADAARAKVEATRQTLDLAVAGPRREDIAAAKATLRANEAQLALVQRNLSNASLYAPAEGIIRDRILEPGDMASPETPVYTLALTNPLWVRAYVGEPDLGKISLGMKAVVTTDSYPGKEYSGWVGYISPTAEFTPKSVETVQIRTHLVYQVRVFVTNSQDELRLGMPATVTIALGQPHPETVPPPKTEHEAP